MTTVKDGDNGNNGYNTAVVHLYKRTATAISSVGFSDNLTYTFSTHKLSSTPNGWSQSIPAGTDPLYVTAATVYNTLNTDTIYASEWSTPVIMTKDGVNTASVFLYQRGATAPAKPTVTTTYTFSTGALSGNLNGWSQSIPATNGNPCWVIQATAISAESTDTILASEWSEQRKLVEDGTSPIFADLDNEMDSVACDLNGKPTSTQEVSTTVSLWNGSSKVTPTIAVYDNTSSGTAYSNGTTANGIKVSWTNSTGIVKVQFGTSATISGKKVFCIQLTATIGGASIERELNFTVNGIRPGANGQPAALYRLVPSTSEIVKKKGGTYVPSGNITCAVTKNVGGTQSTPATSEYTLKKILNGGSEQDYSATSPSAVTSNLVFVLYVGGVVVDRETIPLVEDGTDGTSPIFADLDNEMDSVACDSNGYCSSSQNVEAYASLWKGNTKQTITSMSCKIDGTALGTSYGTDSSKSNYYFSFVYTASTGYAKVMVRTGAPILTKKEAIITVGATVDGVAVSRDLTLTINAARAGANGDPAAIYNLMPSASVIRLDNENKYSESSLTCSYTKNVGGTYQAPSGGTIKILLDDSTTEIDYKSLTPGTDFTKQVTYILRVSGSIVDRETVPVVSGGADGRDAAKAMFSPSVIWVDADEDGWSVGTQSFSVTPWVELNGTNIGFENPATVNSYPSGVSASYNNSTGKIDVSISDGTDPVEYEGEIKVSMYSVKDGIDYIVTGAIPVVAKVKGDATPVYEIRSTVDSVTVGVGATSANLSTALSFWKKEGRNTVSTYSCYYAIYRRKGSSYSRISYNTTKTYSTTRSSDATTVGGVLYDAFVVFISDSCLNSSTLADAAPTSYLAKKEIAINKLGDVGKTGLMFCLVGYWRNDVNYQKTTELCPVVLYRKEDGGDNKYWYLSADTAYGDSQSPANEGKGTDGIKRWGEAVDYNVVITKALFAQFAQFGSAIMAGDWMLSTNGSVDSVTFNNGAVISGSTVGGTSFSVSAYTLFDSNAPQGASAPMVTSESSVALAGSESFHSIGSAYFTAGLTYCITCKGRTASASWPVYVRIYNSAYGSFSPIILNQTSDTQSSKFYFQVKTSGTYYIHVFRQFDVQYAPNTSPTSTQIHDTLQTGDIYMRRRSSTSSSWSSWTALVPHGYVTTCYVKRVRFAPKYAVDLLTGTSYQNDAHINGEVNATSGSFTTVKVSGGIRSPFTYLGRGSTFSNDFSDNIAVYSASESTYALPWTAEQSGRKITITNYYWNSNYSTSDGYAQLTAPDGKYFYEDGIQKSKLKLSREAVELLGYGDSNSFYGWIVLKRIDLGTVSRYGHGMKMLAVGRVTSKMSSATISYHTFDGTTMAVEKVSGETGIYKVTWNNSNWFAGADSPFIILTGFGKTLKSDTAFNDTAVFANLAEQTKTSFTAWTADDASRNNGSFNFFIMNFDDWIYL